MLLLELLQLRGFLLLLLPLRPRNLFLSLLLLNPKQLMRLLLLLLLPGESSLLRLLLRGLVSLCLLQLLQLMLLHPHLRGLVLLPWLLLPLPKIVTGVDPGIVVVENHCRCDRAQLNLSGDVRPARPVGRQRKQHQRTAARGGETRRDAS